jgi:hypothetical protein
MKRISITSCLRDFDTFSLLRCRAKDTLRQCFKNYIENIEKDLRLSIKSFWRYTKSKRVTNVIPSTVTFEGRAVSDGDEVVNLFADFFSSIYGDTDSSTVYEPNFPPSGHVMSPLNINANTVLAELRSVDLTKGAGPDLIPPIFVRLCSSALATPLTITFNKSLNDGIFPDIWKCTKVTPIHKSGDKREVTNYRPISVLNWFAKIFESLIYRSAYRHFRPLLSEKQHGFIRGKSTNTNLLVYTTYLCNSFDCRGQVDTVYTDFSKAFDRVNHLILLAKISHLGIHGSLYRWFASYLLNRSQFVALYGYDSTPFIMTSGVPQGSNLGPLLFLIYINDLLTIISSECLAFADDLKMYRCVKNNNECKALQNDVDLVIEWCTLNLMKLNVSKCCVISFTKNKSPIIYDYKVLGCKLERVKIVNDLGVTYDSVLSFRPHYDYICGKANRMLAFIIRNAKPFKDTRSWIILYTTLVRSILEYCSSVWSPIYAIQIE